MAEWSKTLPSETRDSRFESPLLPCSVQFIDSRAGWPWTPWKQSKDCLKVLDYWAIHVKYRLYLSIYLSIYLFSKKFLFIVQIFHSGELAVVENTSIGRRIPFGRRLPKGRRFCKSDIHSTFIQRCKRPPILKSKRGKIGAKGEAKKWINGKINEFSNFWPKDLKIDRENFKIFYFENLS